MPLPLLSLLPLMTSEVPKIMPQTNTSSNPSVNAGMIPFVDGIVSTITDIYKSKKEQEAYDKAVKTQAKQMKKAAEEQRLALARARAQQTVDMALQLSTQRRQEQEMMSMQADMLNEIFSEIYKELKPLNLDGMKPPQAMNLK